MNEAIQKENKRIPKAIKDIYIIEHIEIPTTIVECGFLSNENELQNLENEQYQEKLAWGIYNGIIEYLSNQ